MNKHSHTCTCSIPFHSIWLYAAFSAASFFVFFLALSLSCIFIEISSVLMCVRACTSPTSTGARSNFIKTCTSIPFGHIHYIVRYAAAAFFSSRRSKWDEPNPIQEEWKSKTKPAANLMWPLLFKSMMLIERGRAGAKKISAFSFIIVGVCARFFGIATMTYRFMYTQSDLSFDCCRSIHISSIHHSLNACNWTASPPPHKFRCISFVSPCERDLLKIGMVLSDFNTMRDIKAFRLLWIYFIFFFIFIHSFIFNTFEYYYFFSEITIFCGFTAFVCANTCIVVVCGRIASHRIASKRALWILVCIFPIMFGSQVFLCSFYIDGMCVCVCACDCQSVLRNLYFFGVSLAFSHVSSVHFPSITSRIFHFLSSYVVFLPKICVSLSLPFVWVLLLSTHHTNHSSGGSLQ